MWKNFLKIFDWHYKTQKYSIIPIRQGTTLFFYAQYYRKFVKKLSYHT
jgi:hypothetical protein